MKDIPATPPLVVTIGEALLLVETCDPIALGGSSDAKIRFGGAEANVAIGLARLGIASRWVGRLGADSAGRLVARELRAEGVQTQVRIDTAHPTGLMLKERGPYGTSVTYYRRHSAGSRLSPDDLTVDVWADASILHVTGITPALSESAKLAIFEAVDTAHERGIQVSVDLNYRASLWTKTDAEPVLARLVSSSDIVFAGQEEAAIALGSRTLLTPSEAAERLAERGPVHVVVKSGEGGVRRLESWRQVPPGCA